MALSDDVYAQLLALRAGLRRFERWSEQQAGAAGLTGAQHQLLLAIRGHRDPRGPTVGEVADYLVLQHHSTVGLIDRADRAGLVTRRRDGDDHRVVRLHLTEVGARRLEELSTLHYEELTRLDGELSNVWDGLAPLQRVHGFPGSVGEKFAAPTSYVVARIYDDVNPSLRRVLVDRLWPRGMTKERAALSLWYKDVAPSALLRRWYDHDVARFDEFARRYRDELQCAPARQRVDELRAMGQRESVVLLTATKDVTHSSASVLRDALEGV